MSSRVPCTLGTGRYVPTESCNDGKRLTRKQVGQGTFSKHRNNPAQYSGNQVDVSEDQPSQRTHGGTPLLKGSIQEVIARLGYKGGI